MPRGEFSPWDTFWLIVDKLGRPTARGLRGLWLHTVNGLSILVHSMALLVVAVSFAVWDTLQPVIRLALLFGAIAGVLHWLGVVDLGPYLARLPDWQTVSFEDEGEFVFEPAPSENTGGHYGPWVLVLAAFGGAFGLAVAAALLVAIKDQIQKRRMERAARDNNNVSTIRNPRRRGD